MSDDHTVKVEEIEARIRELEQRLEEQPGIKRNEKPSAIGTVFSVIVFLIMSAISIGLTGPIGFLSILGLAICWFFFTRESSPFKHPLSRIGSIIFDLTIMIIGFGVMISTATFLGPIGVAVVLAIAFTLFFAIHKKYNKK